MDRSLLSIQSLSVRYPVYRGIVLPRIVDSVVGLENVSFDVRPGEIIGVVGESGSGKTTLLRTLLLLLQPSGGDLIYRGTSLLSATESERTSYRRAAQVVFQNPRSSLNPRLRNRTVISEPLRSRGIRKKSQVDDRVLGALEEVGLEVAIAGRYPSELSGGQQQRVAIARAATATPEILFADECVSALDVSVQARVLALLRRLRDEIGFALVFVTHDLAVARSLCDTIVVLKEGHMVEYADTSSFFAKPRHPYSRRLIASARATHITGDEAIPR